MGGGAPEPSTLVGTGIKHGANWEGLGDAVPNAIPSPPASFCIKTKGDGVSLS